MAEDLAQGHPLEPEEGAELLTLPIGWHPDPFGRFRFRHWDGVRWTAYVRDGSATQWDAEPLAPPVEHAEGLPGFGVAIIGFVVGVGLSFGVHQVVEASRPTELLLGSLALWTGLIGAALYVSLRRGTGSFVRDYGLRFRWSDLAYGLAASIAGRMISGVAVSPIPLPHRRLGDGDRSIFDGAASSTTTWIILAIVVCVGAPLVEEIFFRGLLQTRLVGRRGPVVGIVVASLLFGSAHLIAWQGPLTLGYGWAVAGGGLVLGATYHYSGRLGTSIVAHALFNAQALLAVALLT